MQRLLLICLCTIKLPSTNEGPCCGPFPYLRSHLSIKADSSDEIHYVHSPIQPKIIWWKVHLDIKILCSWSYVHVRSIGVISNICKLTSHALPTICTLKHWRDTTNAAPENVDKNLDLCVPNTKLLKWTIHYLRSPMARDGQDLRGEGCVPWKNKIFIDSWQSLGHNCSKWRGRFRIGLIT